MRCMDARARIEIPHETTKASRMKIIISKFTAAFLLTAQYSLLSSCTLLSFSSSLEFLHEDYARSLTVALPLSLSLSPVVDSDEMLCDALRARGKCPKWRDTHLDHRCLRKKLNTSSFMDLNVLCFHN